MKDIRSKLRHAIAERNTLATKYALGNKEVEPALEVAEKKVCEMRQQYYQLSMENRLLK